MAAVADPPEAPVKRVTPLEPRPPSMAPGLGAIGGVPIDADSPAKPPDAEVKPAPPQTPTPVEPKPPSMAPGLGTTGGGPPPVRQEAPLPPAPSQQSQQNGALPKGFIPDEEKEGKAAALPKGFIPDEGKEEEKPLPKDFVPEEEGQKKAAAPSIPPKPGETAPPTAQAQQPQPQPQPVTPMPSGTGAGAPQGSPATPATPMPSGTGAGAPQGEPADPHDQIKTLIASGKPPGEAQAIVAGQEPKTLNGEKPPAPEQKPEEKPAVPVPETVDWRKLGYKSFEDYQKFVDTLGVHTAVRGSGTTAILTEKGQAPPSTEAAPSTTTKDEKPAVIGENKLHGTATSFGLNPDGSIDADDNGVGFFGGVNTRNPHLRAVAVPIDVLEGIFGKFTRRNAKGGYDALDTPEAKAIIAKIQSAHVELPDPNGKIHKFPIVDIQGSLGRHPGKVLDMTFGAMKEMGYTDNHAVDYQIIGGDGKPYPIPDIELTRGGNGKKVGKGEGAWPANPLASQPWFSVGTAGSSSAGTSQFPTAPAQGGGGRGGGGGESYGGQGGPSDAGSINLGGIAESALLANLFRGGGGRPQAAQPSEEPGPSPSALVTKLLQAGGPPPAPGTPVDLSTMKQANVLGVRTPEAPKLGLPAPPAAPSAAPTGPDPSVIKGLMKAGFTLEQANAFAAKAKVSKPGAAAIAGAASFRKPAQLPAPPPAPSRQPAAARPQPSPTRPQAPSGKAPPAKPAPPQEQPPARFEAASHNMQPLGYRAAVRLPNGEIFSGPEHAHALDNAIENASMRVSDATTQYGFVHKKNKSFIGMDEADRLLEKHWYQQRGLPEPPSIAAEPTEHVGARKGSTIGVAKLAGSEVLEGVPLAQALKQHAGLLSPDDPRVKKQADNMTKGEHFVPGDPVHEDLLNGLPGGQQGRQRQLLTQAEQAIAEKRPMHVSYLSAPKEAQKFPTRESRTIQYDAYSPEARLMGTTEGQLVGHSFIPVAVGVSPSRKAGEPHQSYIQGLSTNVIANNFAHLNTKLAAMGQKTPYAHFGPKFANDLEGYLHNLNAGHTGTGRGYALGTKEYPNEPDTSHVPYKLSRHEADFLNTVINNTGAFAKHEDAQALRELARINGTLITPEGETNRLRHQIEQHEPGWRNRVLEPSIRSFKTGLIHDVHPSEEHMPATIRPGQDYHHVTQAMQRTSERGRPDVPVSVSLHHTFADNKAINHIEREFSEERISEAEARERLHALGEDPDQFRFVGGSGGLITPYEENPEAITPEEHSQLKDNLRKQWIGGKMPIEDYRRKTAEVPLPEIPSRPAAQKETPSEEPVTTPKPKLPKPPAPIEPAETETPEEPAAEPPTPVKQRGFKSYKQPAAAPPTAPSTPAKAPEAAAPKESEAKAPTETPVTPPAPGDVLPPAKAKKPAKTKEDKAAEAEDLRQAAVDRNDIPDTDTKQLNRLQRVAKGWIKQNPELHPLSAHTYLTGQKEFPNQGGLTKAGIGEHFDADNPKLDFEKDEHRQHAANGIVHDIMHALAGTKTGKPSTAWGWYDRAVRKTLAKISQIAPKILSDPEHGLAFKLGTAITSQGQDVFPNAVSGWHVYRHWLKNGELPTDAKVFGGGPKADAMVQNFAKVNALWKELGTDGLQKLLTTKKTVRELKDQYGLEIDEPLDTKVYGAMALGPKIGAFFSNLHGNFDPTTIDMWFSRTMNRLGGNMFGFSDKAMRQDRMEKGKLVKSHLSELGDLLNSGQLTGVDQNRAQKIQAELAALKAHPQGQLTRAKALELAPEIHNWARERTGIYAKSKGYERSFHPDLKTPENVLGKKLHEGVNELSDAPRTTSERRHWHDIMTRVDTQLRDAGVKLTNADKQALLWFVEKDLFRQGGSNSKVNADYLDAAYRLVRKVKSGELPGLEQANQPYSGNVLKMQGGGLVPDPDPDPAVGPLANARDAYIQEMANNPDVRQQLINRTYAEVGDQSPQAWQAFIESSMNRGVARNQTLAHAISPKSGYFPNKTVSPPSAPKDFATKVAPYIDQALAGSNLSNFATGNQSPPVKSGGAPITFNPKVGTLGDEGYIRQLGLGNVKDDYETFITEKDKRDTNWAAEMRRQQANPLPVAPAVDIMGGYGPKNQPPPPAPAVTPTVSPDVQD